jgi:hypothetical protein
MSKKPKPKPARPSKPVFKNLGSTIGGITSNPKPPKKR